MIRCAACGTESPESFRFCPGCGAPLAATPAAVALPVAAPADAAPAPAPAAREERRVVTVLFSDLAGFTSRSESLDPEDARALLVPYYAILEAEITAHGGVVERHIGDGIMALFGAPVAHEDDPERAIRAALQILERIPALGTDLHARIGINTGEILYRSEGQGREDAITGDAANTAARLQGLAPLDGVVVGEATWRATSRVFEYVEHPASTVKGKAEPIRVFQPTAPRARFGVDAARTYDSPYVGRARETAALRAAFDAVVATQSVRLVTIVGEPGMGKSRIVAKLDEHVEATEGLVTWRQGRCLPYGEGITFWALGEIVKAHAGILESDDPATASARILDALPMSPERDWLHQRLLPLVGVAGSSTADRAELFTAWRSFLTDIAARDPTVIVLEDLHWADNAMLAFVEDLAANASGVSLLIVATARPELFERHPTFAAALENASRIELAPLTDSETGDLVAALLGSVVPGELRAPILERAAGNPLYAEEFVRLLRDRDLLLELDGVASLRPGATLPLPESIGALLAARLDMLEPDRRALLGNAAVIGKVFWSGAVASMAEREPREVDVAMAELAERELVRPAPQSSMAGEDEYAFWHVLARDVAYGQLPRAVRAALHVSAATWLEARAGARVEDIAELLAYHWTTAVDLARAAGQADRAAALEPKALTFTILAGRKALGLDTATALASFERALALAPPGHAMRSELLALLGKAAYHAGNYKAAGGALEEGIALLRAEGNIPAAVDAMQVKWMLASAVGDARGWEIPSAALAFVEPLGPSPSLITVLTMQATDAVMRGRPQVAIELTDRVLDMAAQLGIDPPVKALGWRAAARVALGDAAGIADYREAIDLAIAAGDGHQAAVLQNNYGSLLRLVDGPAAAMGVLRAGIEYARAHGLTEGAHAMASSSLDCAADMGQFDPLLSASAELVPLIEASGDTWDLVSIRGARARVRAVTGQIEPLEDHLDWLEEFVPATGDAQMVAIGLGSACIAWAALGQHGRTISLARQLAANPAVRANETFLPQIAPLVRACLAFGEAELARTLMECGRVLLPYANHALVAASAALAEHRGDLEGATAGYEDAAARWERFGVVPEHAFALLGQGRCLTALDRRVEGEPALQQARDIFARLGAAPALAECDALLAGIATAST